MNVAPGGGACDKRQAEQTLDAVELRQPERNARRVVGEPGGQQKHHPPTTGQTGIRKWLGLSR